MKKTIQSILLISVIISCKNEIKDINHGSTQLPNSKNNIIQDTISFDANSEFDSSLNLMSDLKSVLKKLKDLENNYQIEKFEEIDIEESIVYNGIKRLPELSNVKRYYDINNITKLKESIEKINHANIKGSKDMGGKLYPRATIEELIFKSEDIAIRLVEFKNKIGGWEDIDKSPNSMFCKKNKVYYISSGGFYMQSIYKEIEMKMKE